MLQLSVRQPDWQKAIKELALAQDEKIRLTLEAVGVEVVAWLKSHQLERKPPGRPRPGPFHPGGWRDITNILVSSYQPPSVTKVNGGWRLTFANTAEYAIYLELRDGFFVLSGIMDQGGIVQQTLTEVIANIAPEWTADFGRLQFGHESETT